MTQIVAKLEQVTNHIGEVTAVSDEQSGRIHGIVHRTAELDHATQQNAALVVQGTAAAESLKDQARRLTGSLSIFNLDSHPVVLSHDVGHALLSDFLKWVNAQFRAFLGAAEILHADRTARYR